MFTILKSVHLLAVALTISGFILRGIWMLTGSPWLQARWTKVVPHINDTVLLVSALGSAALIGQYPFAHSWLTAKVAGLLAYIIFGAIALTYGRTKLVRQFAFVAALLSFAYVVSVALTKNPLPVT